MAHDRHVELERHPLSGFGFSVIGGVDTRLPPLICAIVHQGSAQLSGKVRVSDTITLSLRSCRYKFITELQQNSLLEL